MAERSATSVEPTTTDAPLSRDEFIARLRAEGTARYHDLHPFHLAMHEGSLEREQLQLWVINRYYYQTRIPIKDALILSKSEDPKFRRRWLRRIVDHDGADPDGASAGPNAGQAPRQDDASSQGGLDLWLRLGDALGVDRQRMIDMNEVLPGVRFACDAYVNFVRDASLLEAVASSLTEFFSPELMSQRIAAFEKYYAFVRPEALEYFRQRVPKARRDSQEAVDFVLSNARTREQQEACVRALIKKTQVLWHLLDCVNFESVSTPKIETEVS